MGISSERQTSMGIESLVRFALTVITAVFLIFLLTPFSPLMPEPGLDNSWRLGMNQAISQDMLIGTDVVFTFGPYASTYTEFYNPDTDAMMIWSSIFLALSYAFAIFFAFKRDSFIAIPVFLIMMVGLAFQRDSIFIVYPLLVFLAFMNFDSPDDDKKASWPQIVTAILLLAPFGLLPLIKGSTMVSCGGMGILLAAYFAMRKQWSLLITLVAVGVLAPSVFWLLAGQNILGLPVYLLNMLPISSGYTEAMSTTGRISEVQVFLLVGIVMSLITFFSQKGSLGDKVLVQLAIWITLFVALKAGFVRHDGHALNSAGALVLIGAVILAAPSIKFFHVPTTLLAVPIALFGFHFIYSGYREVDFTKIPGQFGKTLDKGFKDLNVRLSGKGNFKQRYEAKLTEFKAAAKFPVLEGTSDIYNYHQYLLLGSGNTWNPRPVFQGYSAYTHSLLEMNRKHLEGADSPDNIFFRVHPIDRRYPNLDDGASWPDLLSRYEPTKDLGDYLVLQKRKDPKAPTLRLLESKTYKVGDVVTVPKSRNPVFVKVKLEKSFIGKFTSILYKPSLVHMNILDNAGKQKNYFRFVPQIAESGFVISPIVWNSESFAQLYGSSGYYQNKLTDAFSLEIQKGLGGWQNHFDVEFYAIEIEQTDFAKGNMTSVTPVSDEVTVSMTDACRFSVDAILDKPRPKTTIELTSYVKVSGWAFFGEQSTGKSAENPQIVLVGADGSMSTLPVSSFSRPDLVKGFKNENLLKAGIKSSGDISTLKPGDYTLRIGDLSETDLQVCSQGYDFKILN